MRPMMNYYERKKNHRSCFVYYNNIMYVYVFSDATRRYNWYLIIIHGNSERRRWRPLSETAVVFTIILNYFIVTLIRK